MYVFFEGTLRCEEGEIDTIKRYEELDISDSFMFAKVMSDEKLCRPILEEILDIRIRRIEYLEYEDTLKITAQSKGIRLDIYVEDDNNTVYNLEMQAENSGNIPKRSRYYQDIIDLNIIEKGDEYDKLKESIVIFICTFDLFNRGQYRYTFENMCNEEPDLILKDDTRKIFLNTKGTKGNISENLKDFLSYIDGNKANRELTKQIDLSVLKARDNHQWRREYMSLYVELRDKYNKGKADGMEIGMSQGITKGISQGIDHVNLLNEKLIKLGRREEMLKAVTDKELQEQLMKELGI